MDIYFVGPNRFNALENPFFEEIGAVAFAEYMNWNVYKHSSTIVMEEMKEVF